VKNKLKVLVLSLLLYGLNAGLAFACFDGYEEARKQQIVGSRGPDFIFSPALGKSTQEIMIDMDYNSLLSSPLTGGLSNLVQQKIAFDQSSFEGEVAFYFTESSIVKYYLLLEQVGSFDPCYQKREISEQTQNKTVHEGYLSSVTLPAGYTLTTYEKRTKTAVKQIVIFTYPQQPQSLAPFPRQMIVSRGFYPLELEAQLKSYLLAYLAANIPSWTFEPEELPDTN
jgi:hypothetical protein